ncbi:MAG: tRNA dimethylallyltransferase [Oleiphilaceae bacterium]|jgi:tRNA dimethylallyltransferase
MSPGHIILTGNPITKTDIVQGLISNNMTYNQHSPLITLLGPTASGKTKLAVSLAKNLTGEIISADSRQVYRGMNIGTGKDLDEYQEIPYHLIDIIAPAEEYNLFEFSKGFCRSFQDIKARQALPFLVGGTGMYLDAVLNRYKLTVSKPERKLETLLEKKSDNELKTILLALNPKQHNGTDLQDRTRLIQAIHIATSIEQNAPELVWPVFSALIIGIKVPREEIRHRITARLQARLKEGMIEEVVQLNKKGVPWGKLDFFGLEYRFIAKHLQGELSYNDMFQKLNAAIHYFAKQQEKWFRKMERGGLQIHWLEQDEQLFENAQQLIQHFVEDAS